MVELVEDLRLEMVRSNAGMGLFARRVAEYMQQVGRSPGRLPWMHRRLVNTLITLSGQHFRRKFLKLKLDDSLRCRARQSESFQQFVIRREIKFTPICGATFASKDFVIPLE